MASVRDFVNNPWIDLAIEKHDDQAAIGGELLAFARTIIDRPENYQKIVNSDAGRAVFIQCSAVLNELILWTVRMWEDNGYSLPRFASSIASKVDEIVRGRNLAHPDWPEAQLQLSLVATEVSQFCDEVASLKGSDTVARLKAWRDENLGHILKAGQAPAGKRLRKLGISEDFSWNEVTALVVRSLELLSKGRLIFWFQSVNYLQQSISLQKHCESYWRLLPNFSDLEQHERDQKISARQL